MNTTTNKALVIAFVVVAAIFLLFSGGAISGAMMNGMHGSGWMSERSWMWIPAQITLVLGLVLGLVIGWGNLKKKKKL